MGADDIRITDEELANTNPYRQPAEAPAQAEPATDNGQHPDTVAQGQGQPTGTVPGAPPVTQGQSFEFDGEHLSREQIQENLRQYKAMQGQQQGFQSQQQQFQQAQQQLAQNFQYLQGLQQQMQPFQGRDPNVLQAVFKWDDAFKRDPKFYQYMQAAAGSYDPTTNGGQFHPLDPRMEQAMQVQQMQQQLQQLQTAQQQNPALNMVYQQQGQQVASALTAMQSQPQLASFPWGQKDPGTGKDAIQTVLDDMQADEDRARQMGQPGLPSYDPAPYFWRRYGPQVAQLAAQQAAIQQSQATQQQNRAGQVFSPQRAHVPVAAGAKPFDYSQSWETIGAQAMQRASQGEWGWGSNGNQG